MYTYLNIKRLKDTQPKHQKTQKKKHSQHQKTKGNQPKPTRTLGKSLQTTYRTYGVREKMAPFIRFLREGSVADVTSPSCFDLANVVRPSNMAKVRHSVRRRHPVLSTEHEVL